MRDFNAVGIEHSVARLMKVNRRGQCWDADIFRNGRPSDLAEMLDKVAGELEQRYLFLPISHEPATPGALLSVSVSGLREQAALLREHKKAEPTNYHWEIFGAVLLSVAALLEIVEAMQPRQ